jgi:hypothetical protein
MLSLAYGFCNANIGPLQEKARSSRAGHRIGKSCRFNLPENVFFFIRSSQKKFMV